MTTEYVLRALLRSLILPPTGPMLLMLGGFASLRRWPRTGAMLVGTGFLSLWLLGTPVVADRLARASQSVPALDLTQISGAQAVVILSAGVRSRAPEYGGDAPDADTLERIAYGAYVAKRTGLPVLVSGGSLTGDTPLASTMRQFLERDFNTPVRWVEGTSLDTHQNAVASAKILRAAQVERVILVTSAGHMGRAAAEFRAAGLQIIAAPVGLVSTDYRGILTLVPNAAALGRSQRALYELLGDCVRRVRAEFSRFSD